ncbi:hypothetical protein TNCV_616441 [Trichonephila clavipes]|nr:hypothetical protein TNCV_616441 [Trichonephila clavipes]
MLVEAYGGNALSRAQCYMWFGMEMPYELLGSMPVGIHSTVLPMSTSPVGWTIECEKRQAYSQQPIFTILDDRGPA